MVSETLNPAPFPTGHGHREPIMAGSMAFMRSWRLWQLSPARTNASQPTPTPHSHALPCCHVLSMPRAPCTLCPPPLSLPFPPPILSDTAFTLSRYPVPLSLPTALPLHPASPAGRFTHRVPQTGSNACLGFPLIDTNPSSLYALLSMKTTRQWETPPPARPLPTPCVAGGTARKRKALLLGTASLPLAVLSPTYVTSTCHLQHMRLAVCCAITPRGRSRVPCLEWMPARLGR